MVERVTLGESADHDSYECCDQGPAYCDQGDSIRAGPGGAQQSLEELKDGVLENPKPVTNQPLASELNDKTHSMPANWEEEPYDAA